MNNGFTPEKVDKLADLLLIGLTPQENKMVFQEFDAIEDNINRITKIKNISSVKPMTHALDDFKFKLREDVAEESVKIDDALKNCDRIDDREVEVPKVVG